MGLSCSKFKAFSKENASDKSPTKDHSVEIDKQSKAAEHLVLGNTAVLVENVDPRQPLTSREMFKLHTSWKAIHRNITETGVEMFIQVFNHDRKLFKIFMEYGAIHQPDESNLRENVKLVKHAEGVMRVLDEAILNLANYEMMVEKLRLVGASHHRFQNFSSDNFWAFEEAFLQAVRLTLSGRYSESIESIYKTTIKFLISQIEYGFNHNPTK